MVRGFLSLMVVIAGGAFGCVAGGFPDRAGAPKPDDDADSTFDTELAPPPISGGTLLISQDGRTAFASDPDRDRVWAVDLGGDAPRVRFATELEPGDEPGRIVEDAAGRVHVALRRGGAVASFDPGFAQEVTRRSVCAEPRGIAYDARTDQIHVACTSGELVSLPAAGGAAVRRLAIEGGDLRDVVVEGDHLLVSRMKTAQLLTVESDGLVSDQRAPSGFNDSQRDWVPDVAWRTVGRPEGGAVMVHQRATNQSLPTGPGAYYSSACDSGVVHTTITQFGEYAMPDQAQLMRAPVPVDIALSADGQEYAIAAAGSRTVVRGSLVSVQTGVNATFTCELAADFHSVDGEPVAVAFHGENVVVQVRDSARLVVLHPSDFNNGTPGVEARFDASVGTHSGHALFHGAVETTSLACASCHPEGREDGRVWNFDIGARRTQSLTGGILQTQPLHWGGDLPTFNALIDETLVNRMLGEEPSPERVSSMAEWLDGLPAPLAAPPPTSLDAIARGQEIFEGSAHCNACHSGERLTNDQTVDVGTGGAFQVPSLLGIAARAPYLHDGAAATLRDRFSTVGGGDRHGTTSHLTEAEIGDLVAYVETL